jgi:hypothetical protein
MLDDSTLESFSRQIVLPQVGGRGQERLLAAHVAVAGDGDAAGLVVDLLVRAGVGGVEARPRTGASRDAAVLVDLTADGALARRAGATAAVHATRAGLRARVTTLVGRPCAACLPDDGNGPDAGDAGALAQAATLALAALAATECLRALLLAPVRGRETAIDLRSGACEARELPATAGCASCGTGA